tara:strand:- start:618 stop:860 length:243 start_codon:yes stop_codon:yes gene_type:complete
MLVKHKNIIIDIPKDEDEPSEEYNKRVIFIIKNISESRYSFDDLIELSHIYKFKETLCCSYDEKTESVIKELGDNLYIKL